MKRSPGNTIANGHELARLLARAQEQFRSGQLGTAAKHLQKAIKFNPRDPRSYLLLARVQQSQGRPQDSIKTYKQCLRQMPDNFDALFNLGMLYKRSGRVDAAIDCYQRALQQRIDIPELYNNLGNAWLDKGDSAQAIDAYQRALELKPEFAGAWHNLGRLYLQMNQPADALPPLRRARQLQSDDEQIVKDLSLCLSLLPLDADDPELAEDLQACLARPRIDGRALSRAVCRYLRQQVFANLIESWRHGQLHVSPATLEQLQQPLLLAVLRREPLCDLILEQVLTRIRQACLLDRKLAESAPELIFALAEQCFLNEYLWEVSDAQSEALAGLETELNTASPETVQSIRYALFACYKPLYQLLPDSQVVQTLYNSADTSLKQLIEQQVIEPGLESGLKQNLPVLTPIEHATSQAVRTQYESNPYPRWHQIDKPISTSLSEHLCQLFPALRTRPPQFPATPQILCAGCGTGLQALRMARRIQPCAITAIDISSASLAYGLRQAQATGHNDIRFGQADILKLDDSLGSFDCIECYGVLHHLAEPATGWANLRRLLKPGGIMRIGLYSHAARGPIREIRRTIDELRLSPEEIQGIRTIRRHIAELPATDPVHGLIHSPDFYTVSECRDLMFHVQEHQLNLQDIAAILRKLKLEFIGFEFEDYAILNRYRALYPDDVHAVDLNNWHELEQAHPESFAAQYIFWVRDAA